MAAIVYARLSHDAAKHKKPKAGEKIEEGVSVARQVQACRERAKQLDIPILGEPLVDNDRSATNGKIRPEFEKLLKLLNEGKADTVIVWHPDRLYRKVKDLQRITDIALKKPVRILSVQAGDLDLTTPTGRLVAGLVGQVSTYEVEHKNERMVAAYWDSATKGKWHFSHRPFGYYRADKDSPVVQVKAEADTIKELYRRYYEDGDSHHKLVTWLNEKKIRTATGREWTITQLREILGNVHYAGKVTYQGDILEEWTDADGVVRKVQAQWEPIIDWETFQQYKQKRKVTASTFTREATSLLSGLIYCGVCGSKVYRRARLNGHGTFSYQCVKNHVAQAAAPADAAVRKSVVSALVTTPSHALPVDRELERLNKIHADLDGILTARQGIFDMIGDRVMTAAQARPQLSKLDAEEDELNQERDELQRASVTAGMLSGLKAQIFKDGRAILDGYTDLWDEVGMRFDALGLAEQRDLVRLLLDLKLNPGRGVGRLKIQLRSDPQEVDPYQSSWDLGLTKSQ